MLNPFYLDHTKNPNIHHQLWLKCICIRVIVHYNICQIDDINYVSSRAFFFSWVFFFSRSVWAIIVYVKILVFIDVVAFVCRTIVNEWNRRTLWITQRKYWYRWKMWNNDDRHHKSRWRREKNPNQIKTRIFETQKNERASNDCTMFSEEQRVKNYGRIPQIKSGHSFDRMHFSSFWRIPLIYGWNPSKQVRYFFS